MPRRLKSLANVPATRDALLDLCRRKGLNGYETELMLRIYWKKQSLNYISFNMDFEKYGKPQKLYSVRSLNNFHKEAFIKIISN